MNMLRWAVLFIFTIVKCDHLDAENSHQSFADCVSVILENLKVNNLILISEEVVDYKLNKTLLSLNWPKTLIRRHLEQNTHLDGLMLLLPDSNATSYTQFFDRSSNSCQLKYLVITETFTSMSYIFDQIWNNKVLNVAALYKSKSGIHVFTFFPFSKFSCSGTFPIKINFWDETNKKFVSGNDLYPWKEKLLNMHGCQLNVVLKDKPSKFLTRYNNKKPGSLTVQIFDLVKTQMNFSINLIETQMESNAYAAAYFNFSASSIQTIVQNEADIGVGRFSLLIDYDPDIESPVKMEMDCFTWAVPLKAGKSPSMWTLYLYEFDYIMWISFSFCHINIVLFFYLIFELKHIKNDPFVKNFNSIYSLAILIGASVKTRPIVSSLRVLYLFWLFFTFVIISAYQAKMGSLVTVPPDSLDIETTTEVLKNDFRLMGEPKMFYILSASSDSDEVKMALHRFEMLLPNGLSNSLLKIYKHRNLAVFHTRRTLLIEEQKLIKSLKIPKLFHIVPNCLISSLSSPAIVKKGSFYEKPLKLIITKIVESGLAQYWQETMKTVHNSVLKQKWRAFSILHFKGALIIISIGYCMAIIAFIAEITCKYVRKTA